jgi:hypothetical protein
MFRCARWLVLFVLFATAAPVGAQTTVTFRNGVGGYTGTQDTEVNSTVTTPNGAGMIINVDEDRDTGNGQVGMVRALLRFDNIFGTGAGQIPLGSNITSAVLTIHGIEGTQPDGTYNFHRMIADWNQTTTVWSSFTPNGPQPDGTIAVSTVDGSLPPYPDTANPTPYTIDLVTSLRAWSAGQANRGWLIRSTSVDQGGTFASSEYAVVDNRPLLTVTFTPIPEPTGVLALAGLGLGTLRVARYWRRPAKPMVA